MEVLMIAPQPFLEPRGTPISVYQRVKGLAVLGHTIDLVTYHLGKDVDIPGVTIHRIPNVPFIKEIKVGPSWYKPVLDILLFYKTISLMMTKRYDIIHSHEEAAFFANFLASTFRTRHLYDMHSSLPRQLANFNFGNYGPVVKMFEMLERRTINTCDAMITIGSDLEQQVRAINPSVPHVMIENLPLQNNDTTIDPLVLDQLRQQLGLKDRVAIVYTGTFERYQGLDLLIDSAKLVKEQHPEAAFLLVGGKPQQVEQWRDEVRRQGLEADVIFTGIVPVDEVRTYMELADILVSPRTEGLSVPLKIYTYLLSGKPIVATNLIAHTLVLNDDTAVLAEPTKEAFAAGIMKLIRSPELRQQVSVQALRYAQEKYDPAHYLSRLERIYRAVQPAQRPPEQPAIL